MKATPWFYSSITCNGSIATMHRTAYEKSMKSSHAVKVHSGTYYYRGWEISNDGGKECPWNYENPTEHGSREAAETKRQAMEYIDDLLKEEIDLCDIMCG